MNTLESILVPLDGSPPPLAALHHAIVLANDYDARIDVLHVIQTKDPLVAEARAEIERAMGRAVELARQSLGERITQTIRVGDPVTEIIDYARDHADMIVIGTHGRVGRLHELLGSVAEGVVRNAPCPVLTVRDTSGGYQSFAERRHHRPSLAERVAGDDSHPRHD